MKTIGLIGGMSWESTEVYYRLINEKIREQQGGLHSARLVLYSVDFAEIEVLQRQGDWEAAAKILTAAGQAVERAGADFLLICANTMHKVAPQIEQAVTIPVLHIGDATANVLIDDGVTSVGLLGTKFTMEQEFYRERIEAQGISVVIPNEAERDVIHSVIYEELCRGIIKPDSKVTYLQMVSSLAYRGAQGVILGCTEIGLLIRNSDSTIKLYDTTEIHANQAAQLYLEGVG